MTYTLGALFCIQNSSPYIGVSSFAVCISCMFAFSPLPLLHNLRLCSRCCIQCFLLSLWTVFTWLYPSLHPVFLFVSAFKLHIFCLEYLHLHWLLWPHPFSFFDCFLRPHRFFACVCVCVCVCVHACVLCIYRPENLSSEFSHVYSCIKIVLKTMHAILSILLYFLNGDGAWGRDVVEVGSL